MKERPILFSDPMVRAILEGRKTQTRRVIRPLLGPGASWISWEGVGWKPIGLLKDIPSEAMSRMLYPHGERGDRMWVRETFAATGKVRVAYRADMTTWGVANAHDLSTNEVTPHAKVLPGKLQFEPRWAPAIHMPRWASRLTLEITEVRVERVQDITAEDCIAEGIDFEKHRCGCERCAHESQLCPATSSSLVEEFRALWESINAKRGFGWGTNPWVWVIGFKRI